ncbi:MAG TPA: DUF2628 domain-containing protein [Thermoanaerobaculia bacterium]|nr:DUF2628 domain-containing protein [Thermoanaerobaculia bacterium]
MRSFDVYHHPEQGFQAVKVGFSWPGLFFGGLWLLAKRLFKVWFLLVLVGSAASAVGAAMDNDAIQSVAVLILLVVVGFQGNSWRRENLEKRGYSPLGTVQASGPAAAVGQAAQASGLLKAA